MILVGIVELVGGIALLVGFATRIAAAALAASMVGAIATAGRVEGGAFNLGAAPLMLAQCWWSSGPARAPGPSTV